MEKFKGAKPPFKIKERIFYNGYLHETRVECSDRKNRVVCNVFGVTKEECEANAKLIAEAPEMLEMLQKILDINKHHAFNGHLINERIKELIKKITE